MDDRGVIENLMASYAEALDGADFAALGSLFRDATVTIEGGPQDGSRATGEADVEALYRSIVALDDAGAPGTRHFLTNFHIQVDADEATGRSYFAVTQQTPSLPLQIVACGAYADTYARTPDGWAFRSRHIVCDQVGDLTEHML
jgi:hypothetical protein